MRNPHDPSRTPGGSSSGSGAAVGDFQVPLALGSQTVGSTIRPGSYNGVYAMKPTWNAITREGQKISSLTLDTLGLYARSVEDLQLLLSVFGVHDDDEKEIVRSGSNPTFSDFNFKFALVKMMQWHHAGPGTVAAMEKAADLLRRHGATVDEQELPSEFQQLPSWNHTLLVGEEYPSFLPDYGTAKDQLDKSIAETVENTSHRTLKHRDFLRAYDGIASLRPKFDDFAARYDAILAPSACDEAPVGLDYTGNPTLNGVWTVLSLFFLSFFLSPSTAQSLTRRSLMISPFMSPW